MINIPPECYEESAHAGKTLVCKENGRKIIFRKPAKLPTRKIRVDGCVIRQRKACDYLVIDWENRHYFVELKGRHDAQALDQIAATIPWFLPTASKEKFWCFVACTRSTPASNTVIQIKKAQIKILWENAEIVIKTNQHTHTIA